MRGIRLGKCRLDILGLALFLSVVISGPATAEVEIPAGDTLKASLDQNVGELQESCQRVESDSAISRFASEHAQEPDFRDQLLAMMTRCSFPLNLGWAMAEKGISPDKTKNKVERTCTPLAPKPLKPAASFVAWTMSQPPEVLELEGLTGALTWASTYFDCKPI